MNVIHYFVHLSSKYLGTSYVAEILGAGNTV